MAGTLEIFVKTRHYGNWSTWQKLWPCTHCYVLDILGAWRVSVPVAWMTLNSCPWAKTLDVSRTGLWREDVNAGRDGSVAMACWRGKSSVTAALWRLVVPFFLNASQSLMCKKSRKKLSLLDYRAFVVLLNAKIPLMELSKREKKLYKKHIKKLLKTSQI